MYTVVCNTTGVFLSPQHYPPSLTGEGKKNVESNGRSMGGGRSTGEGMEEEKERDRIHACGRQKCHGQIVSDFDFI